MTLLVAWAGADCKKRGSRTSSLYFATDSRISWNKKMDMMDNKKFLVLLFHQIFLLFVVMLHFAVIK